MREFGDLLKRVYGILDKKTLAKEAVASSIKRVTNITVSPDGISIKDTVVEITASPAVKNEIALKETSVLKDLKETANISISRILYK